MSWRPQCPASRFAQIIKAHLPGQDMADLCLCGLCSSPNHLTGDRERPGKELRSLRLSEMFTWIRFSVWCGRSGTVSGNSWGKSLSVACLLSNMQWSLTRDRIGSERCWRPRVESDAHRINNVYLQIINSWIVLGAKPQVKWVITAIHKRFRVWFFCQEHNVFDKATVASQRLTKCTLFLTFYMYNKVCNFFVWN